MTTLQPMVKASVFILSRLSASHAQVGRAAIPTSPSLDAGRPLCRTDARNLDHEAPAVHRRTCKRTAIYRRLRVASLEQSRCRSYARHFAFTMPLKCADSSEEFSEFGFEPNKCVALDLRDERFSALRHCDLCGELCRFRWRQEVSLYSESNLVNAARQAIGLELRH